MDNNMFITIPKEQYEQLKGEIKAKEDEINQYIEDGKVKVITKNVYMVEFHPTHRYYSFCKHSRDFNMDSEYYEVMDLDKQEKAAEIEVMRALSRLESYQSEVKDSHDRIIEEVEKRNNKSFFERVKYLFTGEY